MCEPDHSSPSREVKNTQSTFFHSLNISFLCGAFMHGQLHMLIVQNYLILIHTCRSFNWDSSVNKVSANGMDDCGPICSRGRIFLFASSSRPVLVHTHIPIKCIQRALSLDVKLITDLHLEPRLRMCVALHSIHFTILLCGVVLMCKAKFTRR
jgi:hypothetical protein